MVKRWPVDCLRPHDKTELIKTETGCMKVVGINFDGLKQLS